MNCCDQSAPTGGCHQGRDCPVRAAQPAKARPVMSRCDQMGVCQGAGCADCPNDPLTVADVLDQRDLEPWSWVEQTEDWLARVAIVLLLAITGAILAGVVGYAWGRWGQWALSALRDAVSVALPG